ncbi:MAG: S-adenosyl-L-homocysteine hydrolase [Mangrovicoccus sp.]
MKHFALVLALSLTAGMAQAVCMSSDEMEAALIDWYGAQPVASAATATTEIWASEENGLWALVSYDAKGQSCILSKGWDWQRRTVQSEVLALLAE